MSKFKIVFDGYEEMDEYDTLEEAEEAADEMASNYKTGAGILAMSNPGDAWEENGDSSGEYYIIEVDADGMEIDRYEGY